MDILSSILGVGDFERVRAASIEVELFKRTCRVISLDDLILAKDALGREKDLLGSERTPSSPRKAKIEMGKWLA